MACARCNFSGMLKVTYTKEGKPGLRPCYHCMDAKAHYRYIKQKYSTKSKKKNK